MDDTLYTLFFWIASILCVISGFFIFFARSIGRGVFYLIVFLAAISGIFLLLGSPFLAFFQFLIFLGTLLLLLFSPKEDRGKFFDISSEKSSLTLPGAFVSAMIGILLIWAVWETPWKEKAPLALQSSHYLFLPMGVSLLMVLVVLVGYKYFRKRKKRSD